VRYVSTRGGETISLADGIAAGLAPDGGLYVPVELPTAHVEGATLVDRASSLLAPFFEGDALAPHLEAIVRGAFTFDAPTKWVSPDTGLLELFHGPTAAFKDFGARFLAECLARLPRERETTVLVATSGDTGAAVASAFHRRDGFRVVVLYPDGKVSARQAHQLGAFGDNVRTFRVAGTFDDCQRMVKAAFGDAAMRTRHALTSANSISLGRLLPQMAYYAHAAADAPGVNVVVPTGNLGNALACLLARACRAPIGEVALATNANRVLVDYFDTGRYEPRSSVPTLANAMDVGAPSNLERLQALFPGLVVPAFSVTDEEIRGVIPRVLAQYGEVVCPHTACGLESLRRLREIGPAGRWLVAATAHPAKFDAVVEPLIGRTVEVPPALAALLARPSTAEPLAPTLAALRDALG
jgi:threonine synthase